MQPIERFSIASRQTRIYKISALSNLISQSLIYGKRWGNPHQTFSSRSSIPFFALAVTAKRKRTYTREIGYKEQTERNRCNWGRVGHVFLFFFLSSLMGLELSTKNCIQENGKDHVRYCIIQHRLNLYIYIYIYIYICMYIPSFHPR